MTKRKRLLLAGCISALLSTVGVISFYGAAIGKFGYAGMLIGAWIVAAPSMLFIAIPFLGSWIDHVACNATHLLWFILWLWAFMVWTFPLFIGMQTWHWLRRKRQIGPNHTTAGIRQPEDGSPKPSR